MAWWNADLSAQHCFCLVLSIAAPGSPLSITSYHMIKDVESRQG